MKKKAKTQRTSRTGRQAGRAALGRIIGKSKTSPNGATGGTVQVATRAEFDEFKKEIAENSRNVWANTQSLQAGLQSAEFNLRSHQKVINALMLELTEWMDEGDSFKHIEVKKLEDGSVRIDWPFYHKAVQSDLDELKRIEQEKINEQYNQKATEIIGGWDWFLPVKMDEVREAPEQAQAQRKDVMERIRVECDKVTKGEEYDSTVIDGAYRHFKIAEHNRKEQQAAFEEQPLEPSPPEEEPSDIPEGATVFGG